MNLFGFSSNLNLASSQKLKNRLQNQRVVLVGPSPIQKQAEIIDSYSVVARIKRGFPVPISTQPDYGQKTDLWYTNLKPSQNDLSPSALQHLLTGSTDICYPYPTSSADKLKQAGLDPALSTNFQTFRHICSKTELEGKITLHTTVSINRFLMIQKWMGTRPTTGMLAILDLLQHPIKELYLTGFTFRQGMTRQHYKSELYHPSYRTEDDAKDAWRRTVRNHTHDIDRELYAFFRILWSDPRIKLDPQLQEIFLTSYCFVMSRMVALSHFIPLMDHFYQAGSDLEKRKITCHLFLEPNPKLFASPTHSAHQKQIQTYAKQYGFQVHSIRELKRYRGITFILEGDLLGWGGHNSPAWNSFTPQHYLISLISNWDFVKYHTQYKGQVDRIVIPKIYSKSYQLEPKNSCQHIPLGLPKFQGPHQSRSQILTRYQLSPDLQYLILFYPKDRPWVQVPSFAFINHLIQEIHRLGYQVIVKNRQQDSVTQAIRSGKISIIPPDVYLEDGDWYPNSSLQLLSISKAAVFFSSAVVEECVFEKTPFLDIKVDPERDRFPFWYHPSYARQVIYQKLNESKTLAKCVRGLQQLVQLGEEDCRMHFSSQLENYNLASNSAADLYQYLVQNHRSHDS